MKRAEKNKKSISEIIHAAIKLYSKYSSTDISVNELCRENNISKGKFYHYFSSKDDLLMVAASYVIDDICSDIENFTVFPDKPIEDNLKAYYAARINYWIEHTDYYTITYMLLSSHNYEFKKQFIPLRKKFDACLNNKTLEIIHAANAEKNIPDSELLEVMKLIYDNMFLNHIHKIITAIKNGDNALAKKLGDDLLGFYTRLINVLLHGILSEKAPEDM